MTELIVALDVPSVPEAAELVGKLHPLGIYRWKVGHQLLLAPGASVFLRLLAATGMVMLDLKLHDIPRTVAHTVQAAADLGIQSITVRAGPSLKVAVGAARIGVWAVGELSSERIALSPLFIHEAAEAGCLGVIVPPTELLDEVHDTLLVAYVGVRPAGASRDDHLMSIEPGRARRLGADFVIMGRTITQAADPCAAAGAILAELV